jgi:hypothetical protein
MTNTIGISECLEKWMEIGFFVLAQPECADLVVIVSKNDGDIR